VTLVKVLFGRRLANREYDRRRIGAFEGVAAMGLDGLGSSSYGPEAALTVMIPLGGASPAYIGWVMGPIIALLMILFASYRQTISAYPNNGGAYIVAKQNLGTGAGLSAAAALMIDYVLNVAVGISAGVGAMVSAIPLLRPYTLLLCLVILLTITLVNLRGTIDAGRLFALPTYLFVASMGAILAIGVAKAVASAGHPQPIIPPPALPHGSEPVTLWLLMRAFASGCTAMTGVEAVSNGMSAFREPSVRYGRRTLAAIVIILGILLAGVAYLSSVFAVGAMDQTKDGYRSVLSQLASAIIGDGVFYYVAMASVLAVLALSANTSFVDFPRMCRMVAEDGFLPKPLAIAGRRLVFSAGILYLAIAAGSLLVVFGGITDRLIPLFAIGAFFSFTLSQTGMVVHWRRTARAASEGGKGWHHLHFWINLVGALATGSALAVIIVAKFAEGAWITILVIPLVIGLLKIIGRYYDSLADKTREPSAMKLDDVRPPILLVASAGWDRLTEKALQLALTLSPDIIAVHLTHLSGPETEEESRSLQDRWRQRVERPLVAAGFARPRLAIVPAQYRNVHEPILKLVQELEQQSQGRRIAVLIPEVIKDHWYQHILHAHHARHLRTKLLRHGGPHLTVISVPWQL
jgi:amino acid transporter